MSSLKLYDPFLFLTARITLAIWMAFDFAPKVATAFFAIVIQLMRYESACVYLISR